MEEVKLLAVSAGTDATEPNNLLVDLCEKFTGEQPPLLQKRVVFLRDNVRHETTVPYGQPNGVQPDDQIVEADAWRDAHEYIWRCLRKRPEILNHVTATVWFKGVELRTLWCKLLPHHSDAVGKDVLVTAKVNFWLEFADKEISPSKLADVAQETANQIRKVFGLERKELNSEAHPVS